MLYALEVPSSGGDTLFANMYQAYEALSPGLRHTVEGLCAVHSSRHVFGTKSAYAEDGDERYHNAEQATQDAVHPVVIRHPRSGRPALYVNPGFTVRIDGWTDEESRPLLEYLYGVAVRERHTPAGFAGVGRQRRVLGQSGHLALRPQRLPGTAAADAPGDGGRRNPRSLQWNNFQLIEGLDRLLRLRVGGWRIAMRDADRLEILHVASRGSAYNGVNP